MGALVVTGLALAACSDEDDGGAGGDAPSGAEAGVIEVPGDHDTIQAAVDAAEPGDLVLIAPGTYEEAVTVETDEIVLRGLDRDEVILEGGFELDNAIRVVGADGVVVENMTAQNYTFNGFFWTGVDGYRGSYLTSIRNGDYGLYAFESVNGVFEHSYASGSPDAGVYIGGCYPCNAVIDDVVSEWNGLGYSGTNAGGELYIVNSTFRDNRAGVLPNVGTYEPCFPQRETTIVGNVVTGNNNGENDVIDIAQQALGNGILIAGGIGNVVERNLVLDHDITGIGVVPLPEDDPVPVEEADLQGCGSDRIPEGLVGLTEEELPDSVLWPSQDNRVVGNVVEGSRLADIGVSDLGLSPTPDGGNCFSGNTAGSTAPVDLESLAPCDGTPATVGWDVGTLDVGQLIARDKPDPVDYREVDLPDPGEQPEMPDAATAPARPQVGPPTFPDVASIEVPARP
jgi:hypothetical protein